MESIYVVLANPVADREAEFAQWYDERHVFDVSRIPGFTRATRYHRVSEKTAGNADTRHESLAIYDLEGDLRHALDALTEAISGGLEMSSSMAADRESVVYELVDGEGDWPVDGADLVRMVRSDVGTPRPSGRVRSAHSRPVMPRRAVAARHYVRSATQRVPGLEHTALFTSFYSLASDDHRDDLRGAAFRRTVRV